jgi:hypothetical protein
LDWVFRNSVSSSSTPWLSISAANNTYRAAGVLFFVLLFRFVADIPNHPDRNGAMKGKEFVDILIVAVTVIVVAIPG